MKTCLKVFLFIALFSSGLLGFPRFSLSQEVQVWTNLGLYGGQIYDIAIDPSNPDKMFAGSYLGDGLFMTTDGGNSWQAVVTEDEYEGEASFKNHLVRSVKIAPGNPNVIWAAHNHWVEKSTDGGQTWTHILNGWMQSPNYGTCSNCESYDQFRFCNALAIDPSDPEGNTVFVGTGGRYTGYEPCGAIYQTQDGGENWTKMNGPIDSCWPGYGNFDYEVKDLAIDTSDPDVIVIWAVTSNGGTFIDEADPGNEADGTLYRGEIDRVTGAETWTEVFSMDGGEFYDVEVKPDDPNSIFTANDWGIFRHYFEAGEWKYQWILNMSGDTPTDNEVFAGNVRALAFDPKNPDILYAAWKNSHSRWTNIDTRSKVARGVPPYEDANWEIYTTDYQFLGLAVRPSDAPSPTPSEVIFGGELGQGVFKSSDHGQNWTDANHGINALFIKDIDVDIHDTTHLLAATHAGVFEKRGAGDWTKTSHFEYSFAFSVAFDPTDTDGTTYYAGTQNWLAKTTNSGGDWTLSDELPNDFITDITIGPKGNTVFITTLKAGGASGTTGIYKSENGLATPTLTRVLSSDEVNFNVVVIDPNDPDHIFAGSGNYEGNKALGHLYESLAGGDAGTWQLTGLTHVIVNALLIDPRDSNILYAGCGYSGGTTCPVYKSTDGGATWTPSFNGVPAGNFGKVAVWGTSKSDVFVGGDYGNILHYDGTTWTPMRSGTIERIYNFWGTSGTDVFAVGVKGTIIHYDGSNWTAMDSGVTADLRGVWGSSATNVFVVGNSGTVLRYDGTVWNTGDISSLTTENLRSVWGASGTDIFASGYSGTLLHFNGSTWTSLNSGTTEMVLGLWGTSGNNVFAVGGNGIILHYDGSIWTAMDSGTTNELQCAWGASESNVFAVGANGSIVHYDGSTWTAMDSGSTGYIWRVWGASGSEVFAVDDDCKVLYYDGLLWNDIGPEEENWNSITDLEFHRQNKNVIYASTSQQGVYVSPNQAGNWLNLGTPEFAVGAISVGSLYAATQGGLLQCTGTGVIAGNITHVPTGSGIDGASVHTDLGNQCTSVAGEYMMVCPSGIFDVMATADHHANQTMEDVTVLGGDVSWANFNMQPGESGYMVTPDLWIRSVINTQEKGPIAAVWEKGGEGTTSRGDRVIWGYFYASPSDVTWGSANNPDLFVKIGFDVSGRVDVNYFHLSVPDIEVYSDYPYDGTVDEQGTTTVQSVRYIRHWYQDGQSHSEENSEDGMPAAGYSPEGNPSGVSTINDLKIGSIIHTVEKGPIEAIWRLGGQDTTSRGDQVVWGHFYANPSDVT